MPPSKPGSRSPRTPRVSPSRRRDAQLPGCENARNLYVLNLPLTVSSAQLSELFAQYGHVQHCVILAMLDSQARRRGFVDMHDAPAARSAIAALNGTTWLGYPLEVSYAHIQRSSGPFGPTQRAESGLQCGRSSSGGSAAAEADQPAERTPTVRIEGLNPVAVIDEEDVEALVQPLASVRHVDFDPGAGRPAPAASATVTLACETDAALVCAQLDGHSVHGGVLRVRRV